MYHDVQHIYQLHSQVSQVSLHKMNAYEENSKVLHNKNI